MSGLHALIVGLAMASLPLVGWSADAKFEGTTWQLLAIQSMDDAQGTTRVEDPARFTLTFGRDGQASMQLDCNRGMGSFRITPAANGDSGSISFGPIAATRALCPPPHLDERIARDMAYVSSYLLNDGKLYLSLMADGGIYEWAPVHTAGTVQDPDRMVKPLQFSKDKSETSIHDRIVGRQYVDYQLRASAGQRMTVNLKGSNNANYFNLLPPDSTDAAMAIGELNGNRFEGLLPDDGVYTIRVFLMRAAGRRNEASDYTLSVGITGEPIKPVSGEVDAVFPGTSYHARTTILCEPQYSQTRECEALVVRRSFDGTATVELRWEGDRKRRILFIKGEPKAADVPQAMTFIRHERGWRVSFNGDEHFEIPESLVYGG